MKFAGRAGSITFVGVMMSERRHLILGPLQSGDDVHRVVRIWPRCAKAEGAAGRRELIRDRDPNISSILSLAKYERDVQQDDYRRRMIINGLALVVTVALIATGVWLAANIHD
jgi:hypothetical protein